MKIKFWGVRGSIPTPGSNTVKYGGNTTCIEIRTKNNELIILDGGTGIYPLGQHLLKELPITANIFITHSHWDHIHGLPFFAPIFIPDAKIRLHGGLDPISGNGIEQIMSVQMQHNFFPVREAELKSDLSYITLIPGDTLRIGSAKVTPILLNHPVPDLGYLIECDGSSIFFTGDHEPPYNIYKPQDDEFDEYQTIIRERNQSIVDSIGNVDILIADASYTDEEYASKQGWGHGTYSTCIEMASECNAKKLILTHHEPTRSDQELETIFDGLKQRQNTSANTSSAEIYLAYEGFELEV